MMCWTYITNIVIYNVQRPQTIFFLCLVKIHSFFVRFLKVKSFGNMCNKCLQSKCVYFAKWRDVSVFLIQRHRSRTKNGFEQKISCRNQFVLTPYEGLEMMSLAHFNKKKVRYEMPSNSQYCANIYWSATRLNCIHLQRVFFYICLTSFFHYVSTM